jgi:hypothetical protein
MSHNTLTFSARGNSILCSLSRNFTKDEVSRARFSFKSLRKLRAKCWVRMRTSHSAPGDERAPRRAHAKYNYFAERCHSYFPFKSERCEILIKRAPAASRLRVYNYWWVRRWVRGRVREWVSEIKREPTCSTLIRGDQHCKAQIGARLVMKYGYQRTSNLQRKAGKRSSN